MKVRGFVTGQTPPMGDVNQRSFQDSLLGRPQSQSFRETDAGMLRVQNFAGLEKVYFNPKETMESKKKDVQSYLFVAQSENTVTHSWPGGDTYEADLSIWIMDPNSTGVDIKQQVVCRMSEIRKVMIGSMGLLTTSFNRFVIWCESIKKFILLVWSNYDTVDHISVAHVGLDGKISTFKLLFTQLWVDDSSTYALMNTTQTKADGSVADHPYILCFQAGSATTRKVVSFDPSTLSVRKSTECQNVPILMDAAGAIIQLAPFDVGGTATYSYRPACFVNNGFLVAAGYASTDHGNLFYYPNKSKLSEFQTVYRRPVYSPPSWVPFVSYLQTKNLFCVMGDNVYGGTSIPTLVMDNSWAIRYYFNTFTPGTVMWSPGIEMLRRK